MTDDERRMIDAAGRRWRYAGQQAEVVRVEFGMSITRYWQVVNRLLDEPEALRYAPQTVYRLRRLRDSRSLRRESSE